MRQPLPSLTPPNPHPQCSLEILMCGMGELNRGGKHTQVGQAEIFTSNYSNLETFQHRERGKKRPTLGHSSTCEDNNADGEGRTWQRPPRSPCAQLAEVLPREETTKTLMWEPRQSSLTFEQVSQSAREGRVGCSLRQSLALGLHIP